MKAPKQNIRLSTHKIHRFAPVQKGRSTIREGESRDNKVDEKHVGRDKPQDSQAESE